MTTILAFIFVLGVVVFFHETGHFLTAKWVGVKVHVFSLGFPPKLIGRKWGDTEYRIGLLPLGGYVKMAGDNPIDATGTAEEFMSHSKWERLAILFAGPLMNLVLAMLILTVLFMVGLEMPAGYDDPAVVGYVDAESPAGRAGIQPGDQITAIAGEPIESWRDAIEQIHVSPNETLSVTLLRDDQAIERDVVVEARTEDVIGYAGLFPPIQPEVMTVSDDFPAKAAGMQPGDIITSINGNTIYDAAELTDMIQENGDEELTLGILRGEENVRLSLAPKMDPESGRWLIGIQFDAQPTVIRRITNPVLAVGAAFDESVRFTRLTFVTLGRLVSGRGSMQQVSGPIGIARVSGETARRGARTYFWFMALLSLNLGILNLLPIPMLDGGHMSIIALEGLAGRDLSLQVKERILQIGFVMLLLLMVTVFYVDLSKIEVIGKYLPW